MKWVGLSWVVSACLLSGASCGGPSAPPKNGVIESDISSWGFRREQRLQDVEVWVADNEALSFTASYAAKQAEASGRLTEEAVANAVVTRYAKPEGIERALLVFVRRVGQQGGYRIGEEVIEDTRVIVVQSAKEYWAFWSAPKHIIKIGGPGRTSAPGALIEAYAERYPSQLKEGALEAPLPEEEEPVIQQVDPEDGTPRPDWKGEGT